MRLIVISPYTYENSIEDTWDVDIVDFMDKMVVSKGITHVTSIPTDPYTNRTNYFAKIAGELSELPANEEVAFLYFCVGPDGDSIANMVENIISSANINAGPCIVYTDKMFKSEIASIYLYPPNMRMAYRMQESMGLGQAVLPPMPELKLTVADTDEPPKIYVALRMLSLDLLYPIVRAAKAANKKVIIQILPESIKNPDMIENFLGDFCIPSEDASNLEHQVSPDYTYIHIKPKDVYIGDTYDVIGAMQRGAHVLIPFYATWLFDVAQNKPDFIMSDITDFEAKIKGALASPRNAAVFTKSPYSGEFKEILRKMFLGSRDGEE